VHAFEPSADVRRRLVENVALNRCANVRVQDAALSDVHGETVAFTCGPAASRHVSLSEEHARDHGAGGSATLVLPCTTLDRYAAAAGVSVIDGVKIDVMGAELSVLRGATQLLKEARIRLIQTDSLERLMASLGASTVDLKRYLADFGFTPFRAEDPGAGPVPLDERHARTLLLFAHERLLAEAAARGGAWWLGEHRT
jgi:FkbM family methyltransferase